MPVIKNTKKAEIVVGFSNADYICDGVADDVQINAAVQAAGASGVKVVRVIGAGPSSPYDITDTIDNDQGVLVKGDINTHFTKATYWKASGTFSTFAKISSLTPGGFEDIYMDGDNNVTDGILIGSSSLTTKVKNPRLRNLTISGFTGRGIGGVGLIASGSWDDATFDNVRVRLCGVGVENASTQTTFLGGSLGGNTTALAIPVSSAGNFFGTTFTTNTADIDVQTDASTGNYGFFSTYHESATDSILQRSVAPSGADTLGGFTFVGSYLRNQSAAGSGYVFDLTDFGCTVTATNCSFDAAGGSSRTINVGTNTKVIVNGIGIGNVPLFAGATGNASINKGSTFSVNTTTNANTMNINTPASTDSAAEVIIQSSAAGAKPLVLQGASSQSGRMMVVKNVGGGEIMFVSNIGRVFADSGSNSTPSYGDAGDTDTGMYFPAANTVGFTTGGTQRATIDSTAAAFSVDVTVPDEAYDATNWNGSLEVPTKNAIRDKIETLAAGSGITRTVVVTSGSATMGSSASTDYVYFVSGAHTMSLPAASGNTNRYTVKNNHSAAITVDTVGAENVEGAASLSLGVSESIDILSDGTDWFVA